MEKLQSALKKARKQRDRSAPVPQPSASAKPLIGGAMQKRPDINAWEDIPLVELNTADLVKNRVLTAGSATQYSASFDLLRTKIQLQMEKNGWRRLAITSPSKSSGKTTVCANIAFALSRQNSKSTLVYEFDMRRPSVAKVFGLEPKHSTADFLNGHVSFAEQALRIGPSVAVSCNPGPLPSPSDLFLNPKTLQRLNAAEAEFEPDIVMFDLPPLYAGDDATAFFPNVDCVLLIAESENCTLKQIDLAEREIAEHTNFLGVVLNKCRYPEENEGYSYNQSYA
ncbi:MAG: CpsD/CapB family tyrosine-protein kinase [Dinoroseobacter sp.]|nr:CpsD/CapB family tyrosine-protein kinase [Dinoroseobacter sp.]